MTLYVYILASERNGTLYTGVTNNLSRRIEEHRTGRGSKFAADYGIKKLVYAEAFDDAEAAIAHEKRLKKWRRSWKLALIEKSNPDWADLSSCVG